MQGREVLQRLCQCYNAFRKAPSGHRQTSSEFRSGSQGGTRFARGCVISRLENCPKSFGIALSPAARERRIVVHENVRTIGDRPAFKECVKKNEELTILVSGRIEVFFVRARELPIVKVRARVAFPLRIGIESRGQGRGNRGGIRPKLDAQKVGGVKPGRKRVE